MKREFDSSKAVKGKLYRKGVTLRVPIYLGAKLQNQLERIARKNGKDLGDIVNELVKKDVELLEEFT